MEDSIFYNKVKGTSWDYLYNTIDSISLPIIRLSYPGLNIIHINQKANQDIYESRNYCGSMENSDENNAEMILDFKSEEFKRCMEEMQQTREAVYLREKKIKKGEKITCVNIMYQPVKNSEGRIEELLVILLDITPYIEKIGVLEELIKDQERFFNFISHEFKTPLTVISSAVQVMKSVCRNELSDLMKGFISQIQRSTYQQIRLVNNLLDITRSESGYMRVHKRNVDIISVTKSLTDSVSLFAKEKGVLLEYLPSFASKIISLDDEKYERILLNLLSNAIKFTPRDKHVYISIYRKRNKVYVEVKDEGIGIPLNKQHVIFDRYRQVENEYIRTSQGTGIGLSLVKQLIKLLDGKISLSSECGKGSTFTIALPDIRSDEDESSNLKQSAEDDRIIQAANIEFSSIYLD